MMEKAAQQVQTVKYFQQNYKSDRKESFAITYRSLHGKKQ